MEALIKRAIIHNDNSLTLKCQTLRTDSSYKIYGRVARAGPTGVWARKVQGEISIHTYASI